MLVAFNELNEFWEHEPHYQAEDNTAQEHGSKWKQAFKNGWKTGIAMYKDVQEH